MLAPIIWFGGKSMMVQKLVDLIPKHEVYFEVFGGGGALLFAKQPSRVEVYNDVDSRLVNFFRVIRDPETFAEFYRQISLIPNSREEFEDARARARGKKGDMIEKAVDMYILTRQSFSGNMRCWKFINSNDWGHHQWINSIEDLPRAVKRLMRVSIEHISFEKLLPHADFEEAFVYLDPPYLRQTRKSKYEYKHEMSDEQHRTLLRTIKKMKSKIMLSGYHSELYDGELTDWRTLEFDAKQLQRIHHNAPTRKEVVWMNYEPPKVRIPQEIAQLDEFGET